MDVGNEEIRNEELWELLYANDLAITAENEEDIQRRVEEWQETLERGGLIVTADKIESMLGNRESRDRIAMHESRGLILKQVEPFRYFGSTISQEGEFEAEVENRIKAE
ncbi:uncharacterized protein [Palaemon carinicauda]|uniref:uncharacterized protein n=1 Tax=Palaemon carinicauda TaxID=392227 RepID=UPI0035B5D815